MLRCSKIEVIATKILRSSTRLGWPLRNVHISNDNGSVTLDFVFLLLLSPDLSLYMTITRPVRCIIRSRNCSPFASTWVHPSPTSVFFGRVRVAHLFSFLYCLIMCLYVLSSMLCCPLCYPHKNDGRFIFAATCL